MKKNNKIDNILIRGKLLLELKKAGVKRVNKDALMMLDAYVKENLNKLINILAEELTIKGKKTLKKEDIAELIKKVKKEESYWEI